MKKALAQLMALCPGRVSIQLDYHKIFGETTSTVIERNPALYGDHAEEMIKQDTIIMVEAAPVGKKMPPAVCYHWDLTYAIKDCLYQIKLWTPENQK